jgi:hypothetical protein
MEYFGMDMGPLRGRVLVGLAVLSLAACSDKGVGDLAGLSGGGNPGRASISASDLAFCYTETNLYRTLLSVAPVASDPAVEAYALRAAQSDHSTGRGHGYTSGPNGPAGVFAENEAVRWPHTASVRDLIAAITATFYREGPGGGHYENLRGPYGRVGCGLVLENGSLTLVQHFRP